MLDGDVTDLVEARSIGEFFFIGFVFYMVQLVIIGFREFFYGVMHLSRFLRVFYRIFWVFKGFL